MYIVFIKFSSNKKSAKDYMKDHVEWLDNGFNDGVFQLSGSLDIGGGGIIAQNVTKPELEDLINQDPFVVHDVVKPEIIELAVSKTSNHFASLMDA